MRFLSWFALSLPAVVFFLYRMLDDVYSGDFAGQHRAMNCTFNSGTRTGQPLRRYGLHSPAVRFAAAGSVYTPRFTWPTVVYIRLHRIAVPAC